MQDAIYVRDAFARIADRYVLTNHVLSCGADIWWRKVVTARIRRWKPERLLDVASGTGDLALEIQDQCPDCEVIAIGFLRGNARPRRQPRVGQTMVADALEPAVSRWRPSMGSPWPSACATWRTILPRCAKCAASSPPAADC
jgi:demethylmenaquinone methyltransferase / 2-methoxy-6-polyprenyl-1,4-benzoquinol methylase